MCYYLENFLYSNNKNDTFESFVERIADPNIINTYVNTHHINFDMRIIAEEMDQIEVELKSKHIEILLIPKLLLRREI